MSSSETAETTQDSKPDDNFSSDLMAWWNVSRPSPSLSLSVPLWVFIRADERHDSIQPRSACCPQMHSASFSLPLSLSFRRYHAFLIYPKGPFWSSRLWSVTFHKRGPSLFSFSLSLPSSCQGFEYPSDLIKRDAHTWKWEAVTRRLKEMSVIRCTYESDPHV